MKEVVAIIRCSKMDDTKSALEAAGIFGMTSKRVMGRGKKSVDVVNEKGTVIMHTDLMAKRLVIIEAEDKDVDKIVTIITLVNCTNSPGDGRIFVLPVDSTYKVHTGEKFC